MLQKIKTLPKIQVSFVTDPLLKEKAMEKAKKEGITLKTLFTMAMKSYINNDLILSLRSRDDYYDDVFADKKVIEKANKLGKLLDNKNL